jgi:hypothetical protein
MARPFYLHTYEEVIVHITQEGQTVKLNDLKLQHQTSIQSFRKKNAYNGSIVIRKDEHVNNNTLNHTTNKKKKFREGQAEYTRTKDTKPINF